MACILDATRGMRLTRGAVLRSLGLGATHVPREQGATLRPEEQKLHKSFKRVADTAVSSLATPTLPLCDSQQGQGGQGADEEEEGRSAKVRRKAQGQTRRF